MQAYHSLIAFYYTCLCENFLQHFQTLTRSFQLDKTSNLTNNRLKTRLLITKFNLILINLQLANRFWMHIHFLNWFGSVAYVGFGFFAFIASDLNIAGISIGLVTFTVYAFCFLLPSWHASQVNHNVSLNLI
jgi:hypothetical protein